MSDIEPDIDFTAFSAVDIRVGTIREVHSFPEAKKPAYKLHVDFGSLGMRWSSAQITDLYRPDDLLNRKVLAAMNLGSRRIAGFKSECLVLGVPDQTGAVVLVTPQRDVPDGVRLY